MPRRFVMTVCLLGGLLCPGARAQLPAHIPTKVNIESARQLNVRQKTTLRVALLNSQGQEVAALNDTRIDLLATRQKDIKSARADLQGRKPLSGDVLELPAGRSTALTTITIPRGRSHVPVSFISQQAGTIRLYGESEKYATGYALVAVFETKAARERVDRAVVVKAAYQEEAAAALRLAIEPEGTDAPAIDDESGEWVRKFDVLLLSGEDPVLAPRAIRVDLRVREGQGSVEPRSLVISKGDYKGERTVEVWTKSGGDIKVVAVPVREDDLPVAAAAPAVFSFPLAKVATGLVVEALPSAQPASGRDPIRLVVRAVDDAKNTILCKDERLDERYVTLTLAGESYGLKFEGGDASLTISADQLSGERKIFGHGPVSGTKVIARAKNSLNQDIVGEGEIEFRFPWWQLGFALLGGAGAAVLLLARRRRQPGRGILAGAPTEACLGASVAGLFFGFVFFGAVAITEMNWNGVPIILSALPIQHSAFAALLIGALGGGLVNARSFLKSVIAEGAQRVSLLRLRKVSGEQ